MVISSGCLERTHSWAGDTGSTSPAVWVNFGSALATSSGYAYLPKLTDKAGNLLTGAAAYAPVAVPGSTFYNFMQAIGSGGAQLPDGAGGWITPLVPLCLVNYDEVGLPLGSISDLCDFWVIPRSTLANYEIIVRDGIDYCAFSCGGYPGTLAVRKG